MVRDGYQNGKEKYDFSPLSISRFFMLFFIPFVAYSIGLLPLIVSFYLHPGLFGFKQSASCSNFAFYFNL